MGTTQMARSMLAHGMLQGNSSQSSGGSYSLGQVHFDVFMLGELALMASIEEHITAFLISKLLTSTLTRSYTQSSNLTPCLMT